MTFIEKPEETPILIGEISVGGRDYRIVKKGEESIWEVLYSYDSMGDPNWEKCKAPPSFPETLDYENWKAIKELCEIIESKIYEEKV